MPDLKRYRMHEATPGKRVVTSSLPEATVFTIKETRGFGVHLIYYQQGREFSGGWVDISVCSHPSEEQLNQELVSK